MSTTALSQGTSEVTVVIPVLDDWESFVLLLSDLERSLASHGMCAAVVVVDDGSTLPAPLALLSGPFEALTEIRTVRLHRNLGHQRAIAVGLVVAHELYPARSVVVMDGDGEDRPEDVPELLAASAASYGCIVFAERMKRLESAAFRVGYGLYRLLYGALIGVRIRFGNFSVVPPAALGRLVTAADLWNHYPATVIRSRLKYITLPLQRGRRYRGNSRMNYTALLVLGLSAISVFAEVAATRLLALIAGLFVADLAAILAVVLVRLFTDAAIPGWATYSTGLLALMLIQLLTFSLQTIFLLLSARANSSFLPVRDCRPFIAGIEAAAFRR